MMDVSIVNVPNQALTVFTGGVDFVLRLHVFRGITYITISKGRDTSPVITSCRCVPGSWLLRDYSPGDGDFRFECDSADYPYHDQFGNGCRLVYYTEEEVAEIAAQEEAGKDGAA